MEYMNDEFEWKFVQLLYNTQLTFENVSKVYNKIQHSTINHLKLESSLGRINLLTIDSQVNQDVLWRML